MTAIKLTVLKHGLNKNRLSLAIALALFAGNVTAATIEEKIELLQQESTNGKQALTRIAGELSHPQPESVLQFGLEILQDLKTQGIIIGVIVD